MENKSNDFLIIDKEQNEKEFEQIQKITKAFKIKNVTPKGNTMLIDVTNAKISDGPKGKLIPTGNYNAKLTTCELRETKDGSGKYLRTMWKITDDTCKNRTVFHNFNIESTNTESQEIARGQIKKLLLMNGRKSLVLQTADDMLDLCAKIFVTVKQSATYGDQNIIKAFNDFDVFNNPVTLNSHNFPQESVSDIGF